MGDWVHGFSSRVTRAYRQSLRRVVTERGNAFIPPVSWGSYIAGSDPGLANSMFAGGLRNPLVGTRSIPIGARVNLGN
jgi:hypothetical protein